MILRTLAAATLAAALAVPAAGAPFTDVLATPSPMSPLASKSLMLGVTRAGDKLVAVGQRGHIVVSRDNGATWQQSPVPVSADLTAVYFVDDRKGWAVGHEGVILATTDGGATWTLQLDGKRANSALLADLEAKAAAAPGSEALKAQLAEAKRYVEQGADKPFLDVWFENDKTGYAVGAYNLVFRTADGGATWTPWFDRTDNPKFLNLYAIRPVAGGLFVVGEAGLVLKLDPATQRFRAVDTGYAGTYFGVIGTASVVLAYGLRGSVYRSDDAGRTWQKINVGLPATIVGGATLGNGTLVLADVSGRVVTSADGGQTWQPAAISNAGMLSTIADAGAPRIALAGPRGVQVAAIGAKP